MAGCNNPINRSILSFVIGGELSEGSKAGDAGKIAEVEKAADAEKVAEVEKFSEAEKLVEVEEATEAGKIAEVGELADAEKIAEVGEIAEASDLGKTTEIIYGTDDIANYTYNLVENPGPLAEIDGLPIKNFYGGRYNVEVLQEDRILFRAGNGSNPYGRWFASNPPESVAKVRIDTAVKPYWVNPKTGVCEGTSPLSKVYAIKVPRGTTIYKGPVGSQGGVYLGGCDIEQIYIHEPWKFKVVGSWNLR